MSSGHFLKSTRDIDGNKSFKLESGDVGSVLISSDLVQQLRDKGLIDSNKKFPVATFWLTESGKALVRKLAGE